MHSRFTSLILILVLLGSALLPAHCGESSPRETAGGPSIDPKYAVSILRRVDKLVKERFWCKQLLPTWDAELSRMSPEICSSTSTEELSKKINKLLLALKSSHCNLIYKHRQASAQPAAVARTPQDYPSAIRHSPRIEKLPEGSIGYVHLWSCDSKEASNAFRQAISEDLRSTDALILDIRDGVGGTSDNMYRDLDVLYSASQKSYPPLTVYSGMATIMYHRNGTISVFAPVGSRSLGRYYSKRDEKFVYNKPIVLLTNRHSASMMEVLAYIMKKTGRATLLGETTAGAVLGAQLFDIDKDWSLYLPISSLEFAHQRLEGIGVAPDIVVVARPEKEKDPQFDEAIALLRKKLAAPAAASESAEPSEKSAE
jgi:hypothetical protein